MRYIALLLSLNENLSPYEGATAVATVYGPGPKGDSTSIILLCNGNEPKYLFLLPPDYRLVW